jgi:solute carrier family 25 (mitochondrial oxoglutarate transporter), member 11
MALDQNCEALICTIISCVCSQPPPLPADATLPIADRRNYKGVGDAFVRIVGEDGVTGLFRGAGPTIARAMALNMGMFAANEQAKELLADNTALKGLPLTASASMIAGFFASACSLPFDFVKTRIQKMKPDAKGKVPYAGFVDCASKVGSRSWIDRL